MAGFSLDDYVDVAERIQNFKDAHPTGSLQKVTWDFKTVGSATFVYYEAAAYRTPDDERPGHGTAWEPFPGTTPYTRNSELMNAETAAWGRAIVAVGLVANRKLASRQEVRARREEQEQTEPAPKPRKPRAPAPDPKPVPEVVAFAEPPVTAPVATPAPAPIPEPVAAPALAPVPTPDIDPDSPLAADQLNLLRAAMAGQNDAEALTVTMGLMAMGIDGRDEEQLAKVTRGQASQVIARWQQTQQQEG